MIAQGIQPGTRQIVLGESQKKRNRAVHAGERGTILDGEISDRLTTVSLETDKKGRRSVWGGNRGPRTGQKASVAVKKEGKNSGNSVKSMKPRIRSSLVRGEGRTSLEKK